VEATSCLSSQQQQRLRVQTKLGLRTAHWSSLALTLFSLLRQQLQVDWKAGDPARGV
jgi:hypothetical protein